jgi:hypothetical protein
MADFISIHHEEWAGLINGLYFSAMVSTVLPLLLPVVIFAVGLSLFIWLYRLEKDGELTNFLLWLVVASVLLFATFKKTKVSVELVPITAANPQAIMRVEKVGRNQEEKRVEKVAQNQKGKTGVEQDEKRKTFRYVVDASGATALLAIPDKIAALIFNFIDEGFVRKVSNQTKTVPIEYLACTDPRYATATIQTLVLTEVFDLSAKEEQTLEHFRAKVDAFETCYKNNFKGQFREHRISVNFDFSFGKFVGFVGSGAGAGALTLSFLGPLGAKVGAGAGAILGGVAYLGRSFKVKRANCGEFITAYQGLAEDFAKACADVFLPGVFGKDKKEKQEFINSFTSIVLACVKNPGSDSFCSDLKNKSLYALEEAQKLSNLQHTLGRGGIKDYLSKVVSDIKLFWYTTTYMDFPLKFELLAKGQGIVLGIITGLFPFIVILSIIPTGRHFMNWPLLLKAGIAYFLVKLWLPALYFVVNLAVLLYAGLSTGG